MQEYKAHVEFGDLVQTHFEGGLNLFIEMGFKFGFVSISGKPLEVFLYVPPAGKGCKIIHTIKAFGRDKKYKVNLVESLNFNDISDIGQDKAEEILIAAQTTLPAEARVDVFLNPVVTVFNVHALQISKEQLEAYKVALEKSFITRAAIIYDDTTLRIEKKTSTPLPVKAVTQDNTKRQRPIGDEDITDLRISLETMDVDSFINSLK